MSAQTQPQPDPSLVLTKATLRAADFLGLSQAETAQILGASPSSLSRVARGTRLLRPDTKEGELALLFLRVFRSLDSLFGGNEDQCRRWLRADNHHLAGVPADLLTSVEGLVRVAQYLDAMRGNA